jgi:steroid delta-isomerase-like uncharacterized protein
MPAVAACAEDVSLADEAREYDEAYNSHDVDALLAFYTDDCVFHDVPNGVRTTGKQQLREFYEELFDAYPDCRNETTTVYRVRRVDFSEWLWSGTALAQERHGVEPTSRPYSIAGATLDVMRAGLIAQETEYYDLAGFFEQMGGGCTGP